MLQCLTAYSYNRQSLVINVNNGVVISRATFELKLISQKRVLIFVISSWILLQELLTEVFKKLNRRKNNLPHSKPRVEKELGYLIS